MVRWENDNRWRDGITSYIKMKIEINNESSRKCSGRTSAVLSVKKTAEAVGGSEVWKCGCAEGGRKTVPLQKGLSSRSMKRFVDNSASTSNLWKHAKIYWGDNMIKVADETKDVGVAHIASKAALGNRSMMAMFEQAKGKGVVTYSHMQHTKTETKYIRKKGIYLDVLECP